MEKNHLNDVELLEAESRIESIHCGINGLGEFMQIVDMDSLSENAMKNIGSMLVVLSDVAAENLTKINRVGGG